jgi:hypothetical protein
MASKVYTGPEWVNETELIKIIHVTPRLLRDMRREKKIPFKSPNQKVRLYNVEAVLAAMPDYGPRVGKVE